MAWELLAAGVGSALGSLAGGSKGMSSDKAFAQNYGLMKSQMRYQQAMDKTLIRRRVRDAKKAGLHPLYALGASPGNYSTSPGNVQPTEGTGGDVFSAMGQGITSAVNAYQQRRQFKQQSEYNEKNNQLLDAKIEETRARTEAQKMNNVNSLFDFVNNSAMASQFNRLGMSIDGTQARATPRLETALGGITPNPKHAKAQDMSDYYGDVVGESTGIVNFLDRLWTENPELSPLFPARTLKKYSYDKVKKFYKKQRSFGTSGGGW